MVAGGELDRDVQAGRIRAEQRLRSPDIYGEGTVLRDVFSLRAPRFDLGRYAAGRSKSVRFDRPGIVRVFCDIHSHMSAFVLVFSHPFYATTTDEGRYRIDGIPPGDYTVTAAGLKAIRATHESLANLTKGLEEILEKP